MTEKTADISQRLLWFSREMTSEKRTQCRNAILMTCHYPDLGSASDCFRTCTNVKLHGHPLNTDTSLLWIVCSVPPPGGATPLYKPYRGMFRPKGYGFCAVLVWKRVETLPILVWNRYRFQGNYGSVRKYLSFQCQMNKKEREICEFEMDFKKSFLLAF